MSTTIDITHLPFSRYGAYVSVTREHATKDELILHYVKRPFQTGAVFSLRFGHGDPQNFICTADPTAVTIENERGKARIYVRDDDTLVIDSCRLDLSFRMLMENGYGTSIGEGTFRLISVLQRLYSTFVVARGSAYLDGPCEKYSTSGTVKNKKKNLFASCDADGRLVVALTMAMIEPKQAALPICPDEEIAAVGAEWQDFLALMEHVESPDADADAFARLTWYNLWSSFVRAEDVYHKDTMLMSKKYMSSVWSWDHCFNALAMATLTDRALAKEKAVDQFQAPFVLQSEHGILPDMWNPHVEVKYSVTKPPIHGWCFSKLMDIFDFDEVELRRVYTYLEKWTRWWMEYSDTDHDGIPDYPQGCDSGWDNATVFDLGFFVETPDLPSFLVLQMRTLARIAEGLGDGAAKSHWENEAEALLARFLAHSWDGESFVTKLSGSHEQDAEETCLMKVMPLVLGELLPQEIREKLIAILERDFLTENGLATEMPSGARYNPDGYWRGPIWAPPTYLLVDGLRRGGYDALAEKIAKRYCATSCKRAKGNYENFDALTGKGLRAPGYTWSASVYMLLRSEYGC